MQDWSVDLIHLISEITNLIKIEKKLMLKK